MKKIPLTKGLFALVDDADYPELSQHKWHASPSRRGYRAAREVAGKMILMHRQVLKLTDPKTEGEHQDGNGLNNQRKNLRVATRLQNARAFRAKAKGKTSRFRGVCWVKAIRMWTAGIGIDNHRKYLGYFLKEEEAALAYDAAARQYFGEFACPNFS